MNTRIIFAFMLILVFVACKKEPKPNYPSGGCNKVSGNGVTASFAHAEKLYKFPCFNPNNTNEFIYYFESYKAGIYEIRKYNINTKENSMFWSGSINSAPCWGAQGKIAFASGGQIYIMNENGSNLIPFTSIGSNSFVSWNDNGDELIWQHTVSQTEKYVLRQKLSETLPDTVFYGSWGLNDWKGTRVLTQAQTYGYYDLAEGTLLNENNFVPVGNFGGSTVGLCWSSNSESFYVTHYAEGLFKVNTSTGLVTELFGYCGNAWYESISCSSDGKFLLGERVEYANGPSDFAPGNDNLIEKREIYLIDLETMEETKMEL